jgi:hypothetical protein
VRIEKAGQYLTSGGLRAEVYGIRVTYCLGFVWPRDAGEHLPFGELKTAPSWATCRAAS